jgi:L-threonylcarbamoyladenylate synthase
MEWEMGRGAGADSTEPLRSPGQLLRHYSPKARLVILNWKNSHELSLQLNSTGINRQKIHLIVYSHVPGGLNCGRVSVIPHDAEAFARAIYAELHQCDEEGAELIVVEALPDSDEWVAIGDRLIRASVR